MTDMITLLELAKKVCKELPEGWQLCLDMEKGSGNFELYDPEGWRVHSEDYCSVDDVLELRGLKALEYAKARRV